MRPGYAFVILFAMAQLAGGSALGQQIAAMAASECPTDAPDSLEISWTRPCEENGWLLDTQTGCRIGDWHPDTKDRGLWSGACPAGGKQGQGVVQWYEHGHAIDRFDGTFRNGKREGFGRYAWTEAVSYEGLYANDLPNGFGTVTVLGESLSGTWKNGCLADRGRVVAIGVARSSCKGSVRTGMATF